MKYCQMLWQHCNYYIGFSSSFFRFELFVGCASSFCSPSFRRKDILCQARERRVFLMWQIDLLLSIEMTCRLWIVENYIRNSVTNILSSLSFKKTTTNFTSLISVGFFFLLYFRFVERENIIRQTLCCCYCCCRCAWWEGFLFKNSIV